MSRVTELQDEIEEIEAKLVELESEGIIGGSRWDKWVSKLADAEGELSDHLRYGNDD